MLTAKSSVPHARLARWTGALLLLCALGAAELGAQETLRVGVIQYKTDQDLRASYNPLFSYVAGKIGAGPDLEIDIVDADALTFGLLEGTYDLGIFKPYVYLQKKARFPQLEVFASHRVNGSETLGGAIVVRRDSGIAQLSDFKGKTLLFVKETSTSGFRYPQGVLRDAGVEITKDLKAFSFSGGHEKSVERLLAGEVDGIAIDRTGLESADMTQLQILESYELPYHVYVFSPLIEAAKRDRIETVMLRAEDDPGRGSIFDNPLGIQSWVTKTDTYLNPLRVYEGLVRLQPTIKVVLTAKGTAAEILAESDTLEFIEDEIHHRFRATQRFLPADNTAVNAEYSLEVDISLVNDAYKCRISVDGVPVDPVHTLGRDGLASKLPALAVESALRKAPITGRLRHDGERWFIPYGINDGLVAERYDLAVRDGSAKTPLPPELVLDNTEVKTYFADHEAFADGARIVASYRATPVPDPVAPEVSSESSGFKLPDWNWDIIGIVVALLGAAFTWYMARRKKRRFKRILDENTELLKQSITGQFDIHARILEQRDRIRQAMEADRITQSQYLVALDNLKEVERVIAGLAKRSPSADDTIQAEVRKIVDTGEISQKEFEQLSELILEGEDETDAPDPGVPKAESPN